MKTDSDFRDAAAIAAMQTILTAVYRGEAAFAADDVDAAISRMAYDSAEALAAERTKRFGNEGPKYWPFNTASGAGDDDAIVFIAPDEPIPYRPATKPPPADDGQACADRGIVYPPPLTELDELMPAIVGSHETQPAPAPEADGTVNYLDQHSEPKTDVDASWGALTEARGPLRECDDAGCACHHRHEAT